VYELKDHLGNVRATFGDRLTASLTYDNITSTVTNGVDIKSTSDYYPFGMQMPNRGETPTNTNEYRYSFNGMEKLDEITNTTGGHLDFGARIYDSRLGRWLAIDPEVYRIPWYTGYGFVLSNSIFFADYEGLRPIPRIIYKNGYKFRITIDDEKPQYLKVERVHGIFNRSIGRKFEGNFGKPSSQLLKSNHSRQRPERPTFLDSKIGDTDILLSEIIVDYLEFFRDIQLDVVGNQQIDNGKYYTTDETPCDPDITGGQFARDRAQFVKDSYFNSIDYVNVFGRTDIVGGIHRGVRLKRFNKDPRGITIIWDYSKIDKKNRKQLKPKKPKNNKTGRHKNVRYL